MDLRRFAGSIAMRLLSMLVVLALPLHGVSNAVSSIVAPAHYHLPVQLPAPVPPGVEAPSDRAAPADHEALHDLDNPHRHSHGVADHDEHPGHPADVGDHNHLQEAGHDHDSHRHRPDVGNHHDNLIGHHGHAVEQADVVYLDGDPDRPDLGAGGKHAASGIEAALPARSMPILLVASAPVEPVGIGQFVSRDSEPPLRPPSARGSSQA